MQLRRFKYVDYSFSLACVTINFEVPLSFNGSSVMGDFLLNNNGILLKFSAACSFYSET